MISWQTIALILAAMVMAGVAIATWGSFGSLAMVLCLLHMGMCLLYQHFVTRRDESDYDNGAMKYG